MGPSVQHSSYLTLHAEAKDSAYEGIGQEKPPESGSQHSLWASQRSLARDAGVGRLIFPTTWEVGDYGADRRPLAPPAVVFLSVMVMTGFLRACWGTGNLIGHCRDLEPLGPTWPVCPKSWPGR